MVSCLIKIVFLTLLVVKLSANSGNFECRSHYDAPTGEITLPDVLNGTAEVNCTWTITLSENEEVSLLFLRRANGSSLSEDDISLLRIYDTPPTPTGTTVPIWSFNTTFISGYQINTNRSRIWIFFTSKHSKSKDATPLSHPDFDFKIAYTSFSFERRCRDISELLNGRQHGDLSYIGFSVRFQCNFGYRLVGSNEITCKLTSLGPFWSDNLPTCSPACPGLDIPLSGIMTNISEHYPLNSTENFSCIESFTLIGNKSTKCVLNSHGEPQWDSQPPKCIQLCPQSYYGNVTELVQTIELDSTKLNYENSSCSWTIRTLTNYILQLKLVNFTATEGHVSILVLDNSQPNNTILLARIMSDDYGNTESNYTYNTNTAIVKLDIPRNETAGRLHLFLEYSALLSPENIPKTPISGKGTTPSQTTKVCIVSTKRR